MPCCHRNRRCKWVFYPGIRIIGLPHFAWRIIPKRDIPDASCKYLAYHGQYRWYYYIWDGRKHNQYKSGHISVGASTAIFGAIGILSAYQFFKKFRQPGHKIKALLPLSCGLALLGILGSGKYSDLMAHLFGFFTGIISGSFYSIFVKRPTSKGYQACFLIAAIGIIATAWMKAF
ncbi:MAG: rhomboid family intramembrane serine protease [Deltaproteobacteria bacterium]|nr:rhomboid family intramembrane serine protease [Deltaproteobacteria bacterium]